MGSVTTSIEVQCPLNDLWELVTETERLGEWVTLHRALLSKPTTPLSVGSEFRQQLSAGGVRLKIDWKVSAISEPTSITWSGRGPFGSRATAKYNLTALSPNTTRFDYRNDFKPPGGVVGSVATKLVTDAFSKREAERSLQKLAQLAAQK